MTDKDLVACTEILESYWARHLLAGTPLSPFRSKFMGFMQGLSKRIAPGVGIPPAELRAELAPDAPSDIAVLRDIDTRPVYGRLTTNQIMALFREIEAAGTSGGANPLPTGGGPKDYTIEHICPQDLRLWLPDLAKWKVDESAIRPYLHTLGNITAATTGHNSKAGKKALAKKQELLLKEPPLRLNADWEKASRWTPKQIRARAKAMAGRGLRHWSPL
jgi:hypothetical protein